MKKIKIKRSRRTGIILSVGLLLAFSFMQAMEIQGALNSSPQTTTITVTVAQTVSLSCGAAVNLGTLTPGTPVTGSNVCTVTTNSEGGYDLKVKRDDSDTTLDKTDEAGINITDKTAWNPTTPNAATWSGTGLGFTVFASTATKNTTWWGSGATATDAANLYAGFPYQDASTYFIIMDHDTYSSGSTTTSIGYKLDVPATQKSGVYNGTVTFLAATKP